MNKRVSSLMPDFIRCYEKKTLIQAYNSSMNKVLSAFFLLKQSNYSNLQFIHTDRFLEFLINDLNLCIKIKIKLVSLRVENAKIVNHIWLVWKSTALQCLVVVPILIREL